MKLSRIAVLFASAAAVIAPAVPGAAPATLAIFEDPFGFSAPLADTPRGLPLAFIDNPRSMVAIFENPFD